MHFPPEKFWDMSSLLYNDDEKKNKRYKGNAINPVLNAIAFLWHDHQLFLRGPITKVLHFHFVQRWVHAFTNDNHHVRQLKMPEFKIGEKMMDPHISKIHNCTFRLIRSWYFIIIIQKKAWSI
jgi:hypothetical protein